MSLRRESVLREMRLAPVWRLRSRDRAEEAETAPAAAAASRPDPRQAPAPAPVAHEAAPRAPQVVAETAPPLREADEARLQRIATLDWDALEADIAECTACRLCEKRQRAVPGMGDRSARVMFVGEGPGAEEDRRGLPFVGAAGQLLDAMLAAIGLRREESVYIANTVKCRPPHNRTPQADEMAACRPYLERQMALLQPKFLVALGRPAAQVLLGDPEVRINALRGKWLAYGQIPLMVTYHPAYLLRNQRDKAKAWEDLCLLRRALQGDD